MMREGLLHMLSVFHPVCRAHIRW